MGHSPPPLVSQLIRRLREGAGLTQSELAAEVGTTQSVISRLESDDYEGHSLSMLYRIAAALDRTIVVSAVEHGETAFTVRERSAPYDAQHDARPTGSGAPLGSNATPPATTAPSREDDLVDLDRLAARLVERFGTQGVTRADVQEAIRWARRGDGGAAVSRLEKLRGAIQVGRGDVVDDVRRARARRGADRAAGA